MISYIVDKLHVGTPHRTVCWEILRRLAPAARRSRELRAKRHAMLREAIARHEENRRIYAQAMSGRKPPKAKSKREPRKPKTYVGTRAGLDARVDIIDADGVNWPLRPRLDLFNHSPTGFEWGYAGSGPAQLALAILADVLKDDARAVRLHQRFKFRVIAPARGDSFRITEDQVLKIVATIEEAA